MIESRRKDRRLERRIRRKEWWFKITVYRKVRKKLIKLLYEARYFEGVNTNKISVVPSDFKYSDDEVDKALKLLVKNGELREITKTKVENADEYSVVIATENRSQRRFSRAIPEEIDLDKVETTPITPNMQNIVQSTTQVAVENKPEQTTSPAGTSADTNNQNGTAQAKPFD